MLRLFLALCIEEKLAPTKSDALRDYLAKQSDRLRRRRTEGFSQRDLIDYAYQLDDLVNQYDIAKLKSIMESLGPGISASVMPIVRQGQPQVPLGNFPPMVIYLESGNLMIEDKSQRIGTVENAGAIVGGAAQISGGNFQGSISQAAAIVAEMDLAKLAAELSILREELQSKGTEVEHYQALTEVATAEKAAREGNRSAVISALGKAGSWVLSAATQIGATLAAEVIKASMGLP